MSVTLLLTLVIPISAAIVVDLLAGTLPIVTIVASLLCIPLSSVVVGRTLLAEMDRVVEVVAPREVAGPEGEDADTTGGSQEVDARIVNSEAAD